jgi:hypothetical protein
MESVAGRHAKAVRRPVALMTGALAGRTVLIDRSVIPAKDDCPVRSARCKTTTFPSCRVRGNVEATLGAKARRPASSWADLDENGYR